MRQMTIVIEVTDDHAPGGAATAAAGCHATRYEETERRRGNERRGSGQTAAPSSTGGRHYGFRSFRDRRNGAGEPVPPTAESAPCRPFRSAPPIDDQLRVRVAAAYGDDGGDSSPIFRRVDLYL